jgi:hypothetical protein
LSELDEAWASALAEAEARARAAGRADISDYLALRGSNDLIRNTACDWLLGLFVLAAGKANRAGAAIAISNDAAHRFKVGNASMVGPRLCLSKGERLLTVELGWPRAPRDGFISGGGLACGNIKHRGIKTANEALRLISTSAAPSWLTGRDLETSRDAREFHAADAGSHLTLLLGDFRQLKTQS